MKFRYKKYGNAVGQSIIRPVIPVEIKYKNNIIKYEVLVDSGADFCLFDRQIGGLLGIDVESGRKGTVFGVNSGTKGEAYYIHSVILNVGGGDYKIELKPRIKKW